MVTSNGLIDIESPHSVKTTADKLEVIIQNSGMKLVARIDHSANAEQVGERIPPAELLIFGNPKAGTSLIKSAGRAAIDLPQKMLAWEDSDGRVWLSYNDPMYIANRHAISDCADAVSATACRLSELVCEAVDRTGALPASGSIATPLSESGAA